MCTCYGRSPFNQTVVKCKECVIKEADKIAIKLTEYNDLANDTNNKN